MCLNISSDSYQIEDVYDFVSVHVRTGRGSLFDLHAKVVRNDDQIQNINHTISVYICGPSFARNDETSAPHSFSVFYAIERGWLQQKTSLPRQILA